MGRQSVQTKATTRLVDACDTRSREGCVTNGHKGDVPSRYQSLATYLAQDVVSPPISLRRIDRDDGPRVTSPDRSPQRARVAQDTVDVSPCIGRMVPHVFPKGGKRVRYDGVQATKTFEKLTIMMHNALAKVQGIVKEAIKLLAAKSYRERSQARTGRDPLLGPPGKAARGRWKRGPPQYGVIYDELEAMRRGTDASQAPRADPAGRAGETLRSASGGVPLSLCGLWCRDVGQ